LADFVDGKRRAPVRFDSNFTIARFGRTGARRSMAEMATVLATTASKLHDLAVNIFSFLVKLGPARAGLFSARPRRKARHALACRQVRLRPEAAKPKRQAAQAEHPQVPPLSFG